MSNPLSEVLPARYRAILYAVVWSLGVLLLAVQAAYAALGDSPAVLGALWAVYGVLSAPTAALAHANTRPPTTGAG